jgi:hypothetical protein
MANIIYSANQQWCELFLSQKTAEISLMYRVIHINDCPIAVGVENPHKFWMCRQPRNVRQTNEKRKLVLETADVLIIKVT